MTPFRDNATVTRQTGMTCQPATSWCEKYRVCHRQTRGGFLVQNGAQTHDRPAGRPGRLGDSVHHVGTVRVPWKPRRPHWEFCICSSGPKRQPVGAQVNSAPHDQLQFIVPVVRHRRGHFIHRFPPGSALAPRGLGRRVLPSGKTQAICLLAGGTSLACPNASCSVFELPSAGFFLPKRPKIKLNG